MHKEVGGSAGAGVVRERMCESSRGNGCGGEGRMQRLASIKEGSCAVAKVTVLCDSNMGVGKVGFVGRRSVVWWHMYYYCYYLRNSDKTGH